MPRSTFDLFLTNTPSFSLFAVVARDVVLLVAQSTPRGAFSEVLHQQVASTPLFLLAVLPHAVQRVHLSLVRRSRRVELARRQRQQLLDSRVVALSIVQSAQCRLAVSPCLHLTHTRRAHASRLLVVALHRLGQARVEDEPHVLLVDAHTIGDGGAHHLRETLTPLPLHLNALRLTPLLRNHLCTGQTRVVERARNALLLQVRAQVLYASRAPTTHTRVLPRQHVNDPALALMTLQILHDFLDERVPFLLHSLLLVLLLQTIHLLLRQLLAHLVTQVRAVECLFFTTPHHPHSLKLPRIPKVEEFHAVVVHLFRRRGGESHNRDTTPQMPPNAPLRKLLANRGEISVRGSEVVPPRANAMRFVHHKSGQISLFHKQGRFQRHRDGDGGGGVGDGSSARTTRV